jgi:signal transduction histidine kinase
MVLLPLVDTRFGIRSQLTAIDRLLKNQENIVDRQESQLRSEQQFLRKLLLLQERERKVVSHEIHDGMIQDIIAAHLHVQSIGGNSDPDKIDTALDQAASSLQKAVAEGRRLIRDLRPMIIDESGVIEAIRHLIADDFDETNVCVDFHHDVDFDRLDPMLESTIFRIVQEALNNVIRHGQSDHVAVQLTQADGFLMMEVRDDGVGFDPDQVSSQHFGLRGIRERARLFGGKATIKAQLGKGTSVHVRLPIPVP